MLDGDPITPIFSAYLSDQIRTHVTWFIAVNGLKEAFEDMSSEEKRSKRAEDFVVKELPILYEQYEQTLREYKEGEY